MTNEMKMVETGRSLVELTQKFRVGAGALLILPFALSLLFIHDRMTALSEDGAAYLLLAKSLWSGGGYRSIWLEGSPVHIHFPPLIPFMLVPFWGVFGMSLWPAHFFMALWYIFGGWLGYRFLRRRLPPHVAAIWTVFVISSPLYLEGVGSVNSEYPYTALSLAALLLLEEKEDISARIFIGVFALFALSFYARTIGFVMFPSLVALLLVKRGGTGRFKWVAGAIAAAALAILPWSLWTRARPGGSTYISEFFIKNPYAELPMMADAGEMARRFGSNIWYYAGEIASLLTFELMKVRAMSSALFILVTLPMVAVILIGWWRWLTVKRSAAPIYLFLYFGPLMLWYWQYTRFLFPVLILAGICFCDGLIAVGEKVFGKESRPRIERCLALIAAVLILGNVAGIVRHWRQPVPREIANFYAIHEPLKAAASPNDIVVSRNAAVTSLVTGLKARAFAGQMTPGIALTVINGATWVIVGELDSKAREAIENLMKRNPERFQFVAEKGPTRLYRIQAPTRISPTMPF